MSPDDHYRAAERLLESALVADPPVTDLIALAQVHATLALCVHPNITKSGIRVVTIK